MANNTVYPYGTDGNLPSSIGIINDLYTGGSDKALSAEKGKDLNEQINKFQTINLSQYTEVNIYINNSTQKWVAATGYAGVFVAVSPGDKIVIQANAEETSNYAILKDNTYSNGGDPSFVTGGSRVNISAGKYKEIIIPEDGNYLYICTHTNVDVLPQSVRKAQGGYATKSDIEAILPYEINLGLYSAINAYPASDNKWKVNYYSVPYYGIFIPCRGNKTFQITSVSSGYASSYTFLKSITGIAHDAPVDYASGYSGGPVSTPAGGGTVVSPSDATYLYVVSTYNSGTTSVLPSKIVTIGETVQEVVEAVSGTEEESLIPAGLPTYDYTGERIVIAKKHKVAYEVVATLDSYKAFQGGAVYGGYLFMFTTNNSTCWMYKLSTGELIQEISIAQADRGFVSNCHCNTVNFSTVKYSSSDPFPIVYVSTGYSFLGYSGALAYRIVATTEGGSTTYSLSLLQTLKFADREDSESGSWTEFIIGDNNDYYVRYAATNIVYRMRLPSVSDGDMIVDLSQAMAVYNLPVQTSTYGGSQNQGHIFRNGKIICVSGVPQSSQPTYIFVYDLATCRRESAIRLDTMGLTKEPEACFIWNNQLCVVFGQQETKIYGFYFD